MKIRIIRPYKDILLNRHTKINEILEVTPNRYKELQERVPTFIEIVEMPTEIITTIENATYIEVSKKNIEDIKEIETIEEEQTQDLTEVIEEIKPKKRKR